jgi:hypothetical protein
VVFDVLRRVGAVLVEPRRYLGGGVVTEAGVQPGAIVEDLDVFGNRPPGLAKSREYGAVDQLVLQRSEK